MSDKQENKELAASSEEMSARELEETLELLRSIRELFFSDEPLPPSVRAQERLELSSILKYYGENVKRHVYSEGALPGRSFGIIDEAGSGKEMLTRMILSSKGAEERGAVFRIRVDEEPLIPSTLIFVLSAINDLVSRCWLIGHGRFADLIEYTQTHEGRFTEKARFVFTAMTYNSPWEGSFRIDASVSNVAEGIVTAIDGVSQVRQRIEKAELENKKLAQELEQAKQKAEEEKKTAQLEQERQALALERERLLLEQERLSLLEKRLDVQKKGIGYAFEIAERTVAVLQPGADEQTKGILIQALLPTILQLQNGKAAIELVLPELPSLQEKDE